MMAAHQAVYIRFLFIGEGTFDENLVTHLRRCCVLAGANEAEGVTIPFSMLGHRVDHTVTEKLEFALEYEPNVNLVFVHRDADSVDPAPRYKEIQEAIGKVGDSPLHVAVIPVQETEAWLLLDEAEIRRVAENPKGTTTLDIPPAKRVERISDPKGNLVAVILEASEQTGRQYRKIKRKISKKCQLLLDGLDPEGPVTAVPSWMRMFSDLKSAIKELEAPSSE